MANFAVTLFLRQEEGGKTTERLQLFIVTGINECEALGVAIRNPRRECRGFPIIYQAVRNIDAEPLTAQHVQEDSK